MVQTLDILVSQAMVYEFSEAMSFETIAEVIGELPLLLRRP